MIVHSPESRQDSVRWWAALSLVLAPVVLLFAAVVSYGVNTVMADEIHYVQFVRLLRTGGNWIAWLSQQHNEHRVIPLKLLIALLQGPTHWSQTAEMIVSAILSCFIAVVTWRIFKASGTRTTAADLLAFAPIAWLIANLSQYENQFYGLMVCHYFTVLGSITALWLLSRGGTPSLVLAWVAAAVGVSSIGNGLLVFPASAAVLFAQRAKVSRWSLWGAGAILVVLAYSSNYYTPAHTRPIAWTADTLYGILALAFTTLGAPLAAGSVEWAGVAGGVLLIASAVLVVRWLRAEPVERQQGSVAVSLVLVGLASAGMVALGRAAMHGDPLGSRYITHTNLAWIGVYLLVLQRADAGAPVWRIAAWSLLLPGLAAAQLHGFDKARTWYRARMLDQYVLQTFYQHPESVLNRLGPPEVVRPRAEYLRSEGLSAFAEPQKVLMLMEGAGAIATGEIRSGQAVEQRLPCPVSDLYDVAVLVLPQPRTDVSMAPIEVTVASGSRTLAHQTIETAGLRAWEWKSVRLDAPFRQCNGSPLTIRVESRATVPGTGPLLLAAMPYYEGELSQAGAPLPGRRLSLSINMFHYGLLP